VPQLRHTAQARADLLGIWLHIAKDNPTAADQVFDRLEARTKLLRDWPLSGIGRPDIAPEAKSLTEPPFLILYRIIPGAVQIVRVLHGAREINNRLFREGLE
jgi:toxin ParE1/3/4